MQNAGRKTYTKWHNQEAGILYICTEYGLDPPKSRWEILRRLWRMTPKPLWDFQIQTDRKLLANQPDIIIVDKQKKELVVIDITVPSDSNIKKKESEKLKKYQGLKDKLERSWKVMAKVVPVVIGALRAETPKLKKWLQQIPETTTELSVQESAVLGTTKILCRTLKLPGLWWKTRD